LHIYDGTSFRRILIKNPEGRRTMGFAGMMIRERDQQILISSLVSPSISLLKIDSDGEGSLISIMKSEQHPYQMVENSSCDIYFSDPLFNCVNSLVGDLLISVDVTMKSPRGLVIDSQGSLFVCDSEGHRIAKIKGDQRQEFPIGGSSKIFCYPNGLAIDSNDNLYVGDLGNHCIKKITPKGEIFLFAGSPKASCGQKDGVDCMLNFPGNLAFDKQRSVLYVMDNSGLKKITELAWTKSNHQLFGKQQRMAIRCILKLALLDSQNRPKFPSVLFHSVPKEILCYIFVFLVQDEFYQYLTCYYCSCFGTNSKRRF